MTEVIKLQWLNLWRSPLIQWRTAHGQVRYTFLFESETVQQLFRSESGTFITLMKTVNKTNVSMRPWKRPDSFMPWIVPLIQSHWLHVCWFICMHIERCLQRSYLSLPRVSHCRCCLTKMSWISNKMIHRALCIDFFFLLFLDEETMITNITWRINNHLVPILWWVNKLIVCSLAAHSVASLTHVSYKSMIQI